MVLDVLAELGHVHGFVVAVGADGEPGLHAHRDRVHASGLDLVSELGEALGVDLHDRLDVLVVTVFDVASGHHLAPGLLGVEVLVVDEDRLADEGAVALLELLRRPPVEVLVDAGTDGSYLGVDEAWFELEFGVDGGQLAPTVAHEDLLDCVVVQRLGMEIPMNLPTPHARHEFVSPQRPSR